MAELAVEWARGLAASLGTGFRLAVAEARLAAMSFVLMLTLTVVAATFLLGAWGLLLSGLVVWLESQGLSLWASLASLGAAQLLVAIFLFRAVARLGQRLEMNATSRHLESLTGGREADHVR